MLAAYHHAAVTIRKAGSVVVCAHTRPDGDAVGSVLGLTLALRDAGVPAVPTLAEGGRPPAAYRDLPGAALYVPVSELEPPDLFVALDTPTLERLGDAADLARASAEVLVMDHHPDAVEFGAVHVFDPTAAATGLMVWRLLDPLDVTPSPEVAFDCYVALMTDTGSFQFSNTTADAFRDAAAMLDAGVDPNVAARTIYQSRTRGSLALESRAMAGIELVNDGRVALACVAERDFEAAGAAPEDAEYLVDAVRRIGGVDVVVLARVWDDEVRVNLRAKGGVDVSAVARRFDGGGHRAAAGLTWRGTYDDFLAELLPMLPGGARS